MGFVIICGYKVFDGNGFCKSWYIVGIGTFDRCVWVSVLCEVLVKFVRMFVQNLVHRSLRVGASVCILTNCGTLVYFRPHYLCGLVMEQQSLNHKRNEGKQMYIIAKRKIVRHIIAVVLTTSVLVVLTSNSILSPSLRLDTSRMVKGLLIVVF
jgi:hypothetical protein